MRSRAAIVQATLELIERSGFAAVNVSAVAAAAGVTRQTVYTIFGTKQDLVSQAVLSVAEEVLADVEEQLTPIGGATDYAAELIVAVRAVARGNAVLGRLLEGGLGNPVFDEGMMGRARPLAEIVLGPMRQRSAALADDAAFDDAVEMLTRLGLSILLFDSDHVESDDALRAFVRRWIPLG